MVWTDTDDTTTERALLLREPVRELRLGHAQSVYRAESLDRRTVTTFTVGEGVDELVCRVRWMDDPQGMLDLVKAGTKGRTITYIPDLGNPGGSFALTLIAPISPVTLTLDPDTGVPFGDQDLELRFRRTDFGAFTIDDYALSATILFRLRGGGRVEEGTFTRADATTSATYITKTGTIATAAANVLRTEWVDLDDDDVRETPGFLLEGSRTNVCLRSQDFSNWTPIGTPVLTSGALMLGDLSLDLVEDDDGAALEGYSRSVTLTGAAVKAVSLFAKKGTSSSDAFGVTLVDSGAATVLAMEIDWDANGVPTVTETTGDHLIAHYIGNGVYRFHFQTASAAAGAATLSIYAAYNAAAVADVGNVYVGGVQVEDAAFPSSYIKTTTATVTRAADSLTFPFGFGPQDDLTVLARLARPVWADASGNIGIYPGVYSIGSALNPPQVALYADTAARDLYVSVDTNTTDAVVGASVPAGATLSLCAQYRALTTGGATRLDVGSGFGSEATGATAFSAWNSQTLRVGILSNELYGVLVDLLVARGLVSRERALGLAGRDT